MDDADQVGLLPLIVGVQEHRVLHDVRIDLALEHGVVGFEAGRELDIADLIALLRKLGRDADLELIDIGAGDEADFQVLLLGRLRQRVVTGGDRQDGDSHQAKESQSRQTMHGTSRS